MTFISSRFSASMPVPADLQQFAIGNIQIDLADLDLVAADINLRHDHRQPPFAVKLVGRNDVPALDQAVGQEIPGDPLCGGNDQPGR